MRKKTITPKMILEATISLVAKNGLETVTARKVANALGIAEGSIYNSFPNKQALLSACLEHVIEDADRALAAQDVQTAPPTAIDGLWFACFEYFRSHGDYAKFYRQFKISSYNYNAGESANAFKRFLAPVEACFHPGDASVVSAFLFNSALCFAIHAASKPDVWTREDTDRSFALVYSGVSGLLPRTD